MSEMYRAKWVRTRSGKWHKVVIRRGAWFTFFCGGESDFPCETSADEPLRAECCARCTKIHEGHVASEEDR